MQSDGTLTTRSIRRRGFLWPALTGDGALRDILVPAAMFNLGCLWQAHSGGPVWLSVVATIGWYLAFLVVAWVLRSSWPRRTSHCSECRPRRRPIDGHLDEPDDDEWRRHRARP